MGWDRHPDATYGLGDLAGHFDEESVPRPEVALAQRIALTTAGVVSEGSRFLRGKAAFLLAFAGGSKEFPLTQRGFDHAA